MRCPKCSYLSYEDVSRCRNCGYDFALAVPPEAADAPTIEAPAGTRVWRDPASRTPRDPVDDMASPDESTSLDLPLFEPGDEPTQVREEHAPGGRTPDVAPPSPPSVGPSAGPSAPLRRRWPAEPAAPLDAPPVPIPQAPPPLVVRRSVEVARPTSAGSPGGAPAGRAARPRSPERDSAPALDFDLPGEEPTRAHDEPSLHAPPDRGRPDEPAGAAPGGGVGARLLAGVIDTLLLLVINAAVVWLTLRLLGRSLDDLALLPLPPLVGFLCLLDVSYLVTFTAASGQSIGKMIAGLRVTTDDGRRVPFGHAVVRAVVLLICAVPVGLGLLPVLLDGQGRGLHDRIAGTRVGPAL